MEGVFATLSVLNTTRCCRCTLALQCHSFSVGYCGMRYTFVTCCLNILYTSSECALTIELLNFFNTFSAHNCAAVWTSALLIEYFGLWFRPSLRSRLKPPTILVFVVRTCPVVGSMYMWYLCLYWQFFIFRSMTSGVNSSRITEPCLSSESRRVGP